MDGILNINKPVGMTSFDVVRKVKYMLNIKKVGHTGTLDPGASGVLPICIGRATKLVDYIMNGSKTYVALLKLGVSTDTYDRYGKMVSEHDVDITENEISDAVRNFEGIIDQVPPMYSALKVNGKRLYELARKGIEIERKSRKIEIYSIKIYEIKLPYVKLEVNCSKGTYIRSLCNDIGMCLGCGGTMWELVRTHTGSFDICDSVEICSLNEVNAEEYIIPMDKCLSEYESVFVPQNFKKHVLNGVPVRSPKFLSKLKLDTFYRVYVDKDRFIGIGSVEENIGFKMTKLLIRSS